MRRWRSRNKAFPVITTKHGRECLTSDAKPDPFKNVQDLDSFESFNIQIGKLGHDEDAEIPTVKITAIPGKHVLPRPISIANDLPQAVRPINGWVLELGRSDLVSSEDGKGKMKAGYRIYITGDTLFVDDLKQVPRWLDNGTIDLMLIHLGGTTISGPSLPLVMVTMDRKRGMQVQNLMDPRVTIPNPYDDYEAFLSPSEDIEKEVSSSGV